MMRKTMMAVLAVGLVAVPVASADKGSDRGKRHQPTVSYQFTGVATADATANSVAMEVKGGNSHARKAMKMSGATSFTVTLDAKTVVRKRGVEGPATFAMVKKGDVIKVHIRAKKGTALSAMPAAKWLLDKTVLTVTPPPVVLPPVVVPPYVVPTPTPDMTPLDPGAVPPPVFAPTF